MSAATAAVAAQAKVNLFLHVLAREAGGYHQVETLMCRLDLADDVVVRVIQGGRALDCIGADTGPTHENLAWRAAAAYADARGWPPGFAIEVTKRIPVGSGLGGGSADAGAVLRALRVLDPAPPPLAAILEWAAAIGADVPPLTLDQPLVLCWGRGERMLTLPPLPARPVVLCVPATRISTREAYAWLAAIRQRAAETSAAPAPSARELDLVALSDWGAIGPLMRNDFDAAVRPRHPDIIGAADRWRAIPEAYGALMSGSGSSVYAVLRTGVPTALLTSSIEAVPGDVLLTQTASHVVGVRRIG